MLLFFLFWCSFWLAFLLMADLINLMRHFLLCWVVCFGGFVFVHAPILKNTSIFGGFLSVPHLVDNYSKIVDERGRNLMCDFTLSSLLVPIINLQLISLNVQQLKSQDIFFFRVWKILWLFLLLLCFVEISTVSNWVWLFQHSRFKKRKIKWDKQLYFWSIEI